MTRAASAALAALAALCLAAPARGEEPIARGRVVERVACRESPQHAYAVYLPSGYTPERRWPILYCFDPVARGAVPVERFREAAERYGWIVVGSHNSRNGPTDVSLEAAQRMWEDTHARFAIDDRRVYTAGFSGGARVASLVAYGCQTCVAGVVACGAGFSGSYDPLRKALDPPIRFAWFATIGVDDFNFPELVRLDEALDALGVDHAVRRYDGGHEWAPSDLCVTAVEWMELHAMRTGARPKDAALAGAISARWLAEARALEAAGRTFEAFLAYDAAARRLEGIADAAEAASRAAALRESKAVKDGFKAERDQNRRQQALASEAAGFAAARRDQDTRLVAAHEFRRSIEGLKAKARQEADSPDRRVARRALHQVFAYYFENGLRLADSGKLSEAAESLEVAADIVPKSPEPAYALASARARAGDRKKALEALARAVDAGFADAPRLQADPAFEPLRADPEFLRLLDRARAGRSNE